MVKQSKSGQLTTGLQLPRLRRDQWTIATHPARIKVTCMGRRWGKTMMSGAIALAAAARGNKVAWIAPTYKQSRPLWRWATSAAGGVAEIHKSERTIDFGAGFVGVYSADNADSMRGESFNLVIVDEAARVDEAAWTDVIQPTLADFDGDAILISTPKGRNWFYREWLRGKNGVKGYASFTAPTSANPSPNIREAFARAREAVSERTFRQEWMAEFIDDGGGVFRNVRTCATATLQDAPVESHTYVAGLDWAFSNDYTVLTVIDVTTKAVVHIDRFNGIDYGVQRARIAAVLDRYKVTVCVAESNSMGRPNNELLHDANFSIQQVETTNATKKYQIQELVIAFERGLIAIPDDAALISELESYESIPLQDGRMRYSAPQGMHDDMVMSLAFAWQAAITGAQVWL
jgi:hypothetical protein